MLNQENFNRFITELNKRLTAKDPSCIVTTYQQGNGIGVRIDYDTGRDVYIIENTLNGVQFYCCY